MMSGLPKHSMSDMHLEVIGFVEEGSDIARFFISLGRKCLP